MAKTTAAIRPEVEAYVRTHYTTTEDTSCGRCGRDDQECTIYFGPTFLGTLQGRPANYDPMCWQDAVEFEMNARADSGEWDPDLEDDGCELCGEMGVPLFTVHADDPDHIAVHCADCLRGEPPEDTEAAAELLQGESPMSYAAIRRDLGWQGRRTTPHSHRYRGASNIRTVVGVVERAGVQGFNIGGTWYPFSRFYTFTNWPTVGQRIEVRVEAYGTPWVSDWRIAHGEEA